MPINITALNYALDAFGYANGSDSIEVFANKSLKRAVIDLLRSYSDPEAVFIGSLLTDTLRLFPVGISQIKIRLDTAQIVIESNPKWISYLATLGVEYLIRELRHCLMHLVLMHPDLIKAHPEGVDCSAANIAMDIDINEYLSGQHAYSNIRPLCPACLKAYKDKQGAISNTPSVIAKSGCRLCHGAGHLANDRSMLTKVSNIHSGSSFSLPYGHKIGNYRAIMQQVLAMPAKFFDSSYFPSIHDLADPLIPFENSYDKSLAISAMNHAYAQAQSHAKGSGAGSLLSLFNELRREKKVPYLLRLRGVLGASMKDESEPTRYRPNRRFGYEYPGSKSIPKQRYVFAIDTSGSVSLEEVKKVMNEFLNIAQYSDKIECRVIFFHHKVYYDKEILDYKEEDLSKLQSGGTDFDAVFEAVYTDEKAKERGPAVLVFHTDGYCDIGFKRRNVRGSVHWLITKGGTVSEVKRWDKEASIIMLEE